MKFRVWNKILNKFDDQDYLLDSGGVLYYYNSDTWDLRKAKPKENHVVQRFTGLLDKSGKEIYEGDIINIYNNNTKNIGRIDFIYGGFRLNYLDMQMYSKSELEIIGNIFQNSELLK